MAAASYRSRLGLMGREGLAGRKRMGCDAGVQGVDAFLQMTGRAGGKPQWEVRSQAGCYEMGCVIARYNQINRIGLSCRTCGMAGWVGAQECKRKKVSRWEMGRRKVVSDRDREGGTRRRSSAGTHRRWGAQ